MGDSSLRVREAALAFSDASWMGMLVPSALMEKRWAEGLTSSSSLSKERERVLPSTEAERREADWGVLVSAMLIFVVEVVPIEIGEELESEFFFSFC